MRIPEALYDYAVFYWTGEAFALQSMTPEQPARTQPPIVRALFRKPGVSQVSLTIAKPRGPVLYQWTLEPRGPASFPKTPITPAGPAARRVAKRSTGLL